MQGSSPGCSAGRPVGVRQTTLQCPAQPTQPFCPMWVEPNSNSGVIGARASWPSPPPPTLALFCKPTPTHRRMRNRGGSTCLSVGWVAFDGRQRHYPLSQSGHRGNPWSFPPSLSIPDPCIVNFRQAGRQACSQVQDPRSQAALSWVPSLGCGVSRARKPSFPLLSLPLLVPAIAEEPLLSTPSSGVFAMFAEV